MISGGGKRLKPLEVLNESCTPIIIVERIPPELYTLLPMRSRTVLIVGNVKNKPSF
jgi:hypothetical protein